MHFDVIVFSGLHSNSEGVKLFFLILFKSDRADSTVGNFCRTLVTLSVIIVTIWMIRITLFCILKPFLDYCNKDPAYKARSYWTFCYPVYMYLVYLYLYMYIISLSGWRTTSVHHTEPSTTAIARPFLRRLVLSCRWLFLRGRTFQSHQWCQGYKTMFGKVVFPLPLPHAREVSQTARCHGSVANLKRSNVGKTQRALTQRTHFKYCKYAGTFFSSFFFFLVSFFNKNIYIFTIIMYSQKHRQTMHFSDIK